MSWNYRVMRRKTRNSHKSLRNLEGLVYGIYEVYYEDGIPREWTKEPMLPNELTLRELRTTLAWMTKALALPVLDYATGKPLTARGKTAIPAVENSSHTVILPRNGKKKA